MHNITVHRRCHRAQAILAAQGACPCMRARAVPFGAIRYHSSLRQSQSSRGPREGISKKADSWKRRSQQDGSLPELFTIRADWAQPPQPPHDNVVAKQRKRQLRQVADAWVRCVLAGVSERVLFKTRPNSSW